MHISRKMDKALCVRTVIRPELNLEKWPLWIPAHSGLSARVRKLHQQEGTLFLTCGTSREGEALSLPTTEDQKLYYGLVRLWEAEGRPEKEMVSFSMRQLADTIRKPWSTKTYQALQGGLERLIKTGLEWTDSYVDSEKKEGEEKPEATYKSTTFQILSEKTLVEVARDGRVTKAGCQFQFHPRILQNLLSNHTRPVLLDVVLDFKSELAQLLYTRLDHCLYRERTPYSGDYTRTTEGLFHDLGLDHPEYRKVSARIRRLRPALEELLGKPYATGILDSADLERTIEGDDYKVTFRKRASRTYLTIPPEPIPTLSVIVPAPEVVKEATTEDGAKTKNLEEALVKTFYRLRYGQEQKPTERERQEAKRLLSEGEAWANHLITFAAEKGKQENGFPNDFGGAAKLTLQAKVSFTLRIKKQNHEKSLNTRRMHQDAHTSTYYVFLASLLAEGEKSAFYAHLSLFLEQEARTYQFHARRAEKSPGSARIIEGYFDREVRVSRLRQYIEEHRTEGLPNFWQWDAQFNPSPFSPAT